MLYQKPELKVIKVSEVTQAGGQFTDSQGNVVNFNILQGSGIAVNAS